MKSISKIAVSLALVLAGLCHSPSASKADVFGIADSALLLQQVAQFIQDYDIGATTNVNLATIIASIEKKTQGLQTIIRVFENGQKGFSTFSNLIEVTRKLARATKRINGYINYIGTYGNELDISNCYYMYRSFEARTQLVIKDLQSTLNTMKKTDLGGGGKFLEVLDKTISSADALLDSISDDCITKLSDEVHKCKMKEQSRASEKVSRTIIC